jgi:hypothetical protein
MELVYRKTERGLVEMNTRELRLAPRLRSALILIDGKKMDYQLQGLLGPQCADTLAHRGDPAHPHRLRARPPLKPERGSRCVGLTPTPLRIPNGKPGEGCGMIQRKGRSSACRRGSAWKPSTARPSVGFWK